MALGDVVICAGGLRIVDRGAGPVDGLALRVGEVAPVPLPASAPVEARRSDNVVWRRHWIDACRLVIEFVDVAHVEVLEDSGAVTFDRQLDPQMEEHLLFDHVLPLVLARRGGVVLHGAVISRDERGAVLMGRSGAGKSTLAAFAWQRGWMVGGDDGAVILDTDPPTVEPTYATVRLTPPSAALLGIDPASTSAVVGKMRLAGGPDQAFRQDPVDLRLIVAITPVAAGERARIEPLDPVSAHAELFASTFHAELSGNGLLASTVERLAAIVERTAVAHLIVPRGIEGLDAAEDLLRTTLESAPVKAARAQSPEPGP
jgi:hypothetical protein